MQLYTIQTPTTLRMLANAIGRTPQMLAEANGLPISAHLGCGDILLIPTPCAARGCGRSTFLLTCSVEAEKCGSAPFHASEKLSLILHRTGVLSCGALRLPKRHVGDAVPAMLAPAWEDARLPTDDAIKRLSTCGYIGLALPYRLRADAYDILSDTLHRHELLLALCAEGDTLLRHPEMLSVQCDLLYVTPPCDLSLEEFLADMTVTASPAMRRKMLLVLTEHDCPPCNKKGARRGRPIGRCIKDCYIGLCRLLHDGYGGVLTPCGRTSPLLYHMLSELGTLIPASQRSGRHSRS